MNHFLSLIEKGLVAAKTDGAVVAKFLSKDSSLTRYTVGKNEQSIELTKHVKIDALIDDFAKPGEFWNGLPVLSCDRLKGNAIVVNCSTSISPLSVSARLRSVPNVYVLPFSAIIEHAPEKVAKPWFVQDIETNFSKNEDRWCELFNLMHDDESRETLVNLVLYRLTANAYFMSSYSVRLKDQYFENFMELDSEILVDIGGFDGDTSEQFVKCCPTYKKIFFFEPSQSNMTLAKERLKNAKNIEFIQKGLSNASGVLSFDGQAGSASSVDTSGHEVIEVARLDDVITQKVTFIKMDIEGWEVNALKGAANTISTFHPKLAIAVYHQAKDFYEIPKLILQFSNDYSIYLRHYTEGWSETIMYFMPKKTY